MYPKKGRSRARQKQIQAHKQARRIQEEASLNHELRKRARHALDILKPLGLKEQALRECTVALAELHGQLARKDAAQAVVDSFPRLTPKLEKESPRLYESYRRELEAAQREKYYYDSRFYKLVLELETAYPGKGKGLTYRVIQEYEHSFRPHKR